MSDNSSGVASYLRGRLLNNVSSLGHLIGYALRERFRLGYTGQSFIKDLSSGLVVGLVAIPLSLALAIASGVPPQHGLYTVIFAGLLVALLGGSQTQVTGPTAAFVVILFPIVHKFGIQGLLTAGFMAGILLFLMGWARLGRLIRFVPSTVVTGFTAGIAVVIATIQLKDFFGLTINGSQESYLERVEALFKAAGTVSVSEFFIGFVTLFLLVFIPRVLKKVPAPLIVIPFAALLAIVINRLFPGVQISTIGNKFAYLKDGISMHGIPSVLPSFNFPWSPTGKEGFSLELVRTLFPSALAIALLGAIESLLSAVVADGMAKTRHNPDSELVALGIGNIVAPFFGGIPATGAIARTATNIRFGATSPISSIVHAVFSLLVILLIANLLSFIPMAAMAALLLVVAYNMSEWRHFVHIITHSQKSDYLVLICCFLATVFVDMVAGVTVGMLLSSMFFIGRMGRFSKRTVIYHGSTHHLLKEPVPQGVAVYDIDGAMFFGATNYAADTLVQVDRGIHTLILSMDDVFSIDYNGCMEIKEVIERMGKCGINVVISGVKAQPKQAILKAKVINDSSHLFPNIIEAIETCCPKNC